MRIVNLLSLIFLVAACQSNEAVTEQITTGVFQIDLSRQPIWEKDHLRLIPITAAAEFIATQENVAQYTVLSEALKDERFRISEKKPYGRFNDAGAVNTLTIQNKTNEAVLLMAGDIIQGGNQDRAIGEDRIIAARSIEDIPVFCVEKGRWSYQGDHFLNEADKKIFAFRGYYNMAAREIRKSVRNGSQSDVWNNVAAITSQQGRTSSTSAYTALDANTDFVNKRLGYERFFSDKLRDNKKIVGFIAISGDKLIGADIMGHPALLNRQYKALLSSYATDAILDENPNEISDKKLQTLVDDILAKIQSDEYTYYVDGQLIHFAYF